MAESLGWLNMANNIEIQIICHRSRFVGFITCTFEESIILMDKIDNDIIVAVSVAYGGCFVSFRRAKLFAIVMKPMKRIYAHNKAHRNLIPIAR